MHIRHFRQSAVALSALFALVGCAGVEAPAPGTGAPGTGAPNVGAPNAAAQNAGAQNAPAARPDTSTDEDFARLEQQFDARLGVYAVDTGTGEEIAHRADDRFAYASTHKAFSGAAVLQRNEVGELNRRITYSEADLLPHSPVTEKHVGTGLPLREVIGAAIRHSDNTAANLLFRELGGPPELQRAMRAIGDATIHVDRTEPDLNRTSPGDIRDTSTPRAMAETLRKLTVGNVLPQDKRGILNEMLRTAQLTDDLIRAGVPADWEVGDKSGAADYATRNDIAVIRPPGRAPIMLAVMSDKADEDADYDNALIAQAARVVADDLR